MIKVAFCDNEIDETGQLERILLNMCKKEGIEIETDVFFCGDYLLAEVKRGTRYDLLFIDVELQHLDGISTTKELRKIDTNVLIIFMSKCQQYLIDLFPLNVFSFLKKPINYKHFINTFFQANIKICTQNIYFTYSYNKMHYKILCDDILFFESKGRQIRIHMKFGEIGIFNGKLNDIQNRVNTSKETFLRIHQSYLINYHAIKARTKTSIIMNNGQILPISEDKQKKVSQNYNKLIKENSITLRE